MTTIKVSKHRTTTLVFVWIFLLAVGLALQTWMNVWRAELWHTDDGSHFVSGAMIAAWMLAGFPHPVEFALNYHGHYPIVGIGLWGPAFYVLEAIWLALTGGGKWSAFLLQAMLSATLAASVYSQLCRLTATSRYSKASAIAGALFLLFTHLMVEAVYSIGLDLVVALGMLQATLAFQKYLSTQRLRDLLLFGGFALFTLLVKGNALALYLVIPAVILVGRHWGVLKDWRLWLVAVVVSLPVLLWYMATYKLSASGFRHQWGWTFFAYALPGNLSLLADSLGWPVFALVSVGTWRALTGGTGVENRVLQGALGLALGVMLFQSVVPASLNGRYLLSSAAPLLILAGGGLAWLGRHMAARLRQWLGGHDPSPLAVVFVSLLCLANVLTTLQATEPRVYRGLAGAVRPVMDALPPGNPSVLIVGFDVVETAFIAEMAMKRPFRDQPFVVRGSRLLGGGGYNNFDYLPKFNDADAVRQAINDMNIAILVIAPTPQAKKWAHVAQVEEVLMRDDQWKKTWTSDGRDDVRVYRHVGNAEKAGMGQAIVQLASPKKRASIGQ